MHCHIHLIPRRDGDVSDPVEGVRHTIPNMGNYKKQLLRLPPQMSHHSAYLLNPL
jgi:diadenosine tetraphosphate (Ap4A) HIT family hydrolase